MQSLKLYVVYLLVVIIVACQTGATGPVEKTKVDMAIEGMVCAIGCAKGIQEKVADMSGVLSCEVNFEKGKAHIEFDRSVLTSLDIRSSIEKMNNGQYKVKILHEEAEQQESVTPGSGSKSGSGSADPVSVSRESFSFPQLLTYFMKNSF